MRWPLKPSAKPRVMARGGSDDQNAPDPQGSEGLLPFRLTVAISGVACDGARRGLPHPHNHCLRNYRTRQQQGAVVACPRRPDCRFAGWPVWPTPDGAHRERPRRAVVGSVYFRPERNVLNTASGSLPMGSSEAPTRVDEAHAGAARRRCSIEISRKIRRARIRIKPQPC